MDRSGRLFELIQILRAASRPVTAQALAAQLEVSGRTIYRDIAMLQARKVPIEGEAGLGYLMRRGYDLPPLNFDGEEIEALRVGLAMLARTGDSSLQHAAQRVRDKIEALHGPSDWLHVAPWGAPRDDPAKGCVSIAQLRGAIRAAQKLRLRYVASDEAETMRTVRPVALVYHLECVMLAAWCELRAGFRHFRTDRIHDCAYLDAGFADEAKVLRRLWQQQQDSFAYSTDR
ncbi:MAG: YafY family transcriptional regulator [Paracoccaceae bacterium]|nr:MAG: YafY family transcriptional regulator [Paracoccaceae bacterium]